MTIAELQVVLSGLPIACGEYEVSVRFDSGIASTGIDEICVLHESKDVHFNRAQDTVYDLEIET